MFKISLSLKSPDRVQSTKDAIAEQRGAGEQRSWASLHLICFHLQMEIQTITFTDSLKALRQYDMYFVKIIVFSILILL